MLHLGDCLDVMQGISDGSVDAVICDPPYGTVRCAWDVVIPFEPMWAQLKRITKPNGAPDRGKSPTMEFCWTVWHADPTPKCHYTPLERPNL